MPQTLDEQREVVSILDVIAQKNDLQTQKRDVLSELLKSLLSNLMTGAIALSDPERPDVDYVPMQKAGATA
jgi:type I restriction enzyme S subunit